MTAPGGLQSDVAVKLLRVDLDPGQEAVRRLRDEGRLLSQLHHPAILRVFDLAHLDGRIGLVSEYVPGQDLSSLIGQMPVRAVVEAFASVAEALDEAWTHTCADGSALHLVHRDIKPSNIRIGSHGEVKVLDFGIARSMSEEDGRLARTGTNATVGSLAYMAPERFSRAAPGPEADVFGLGCAMFELLAGVRVFEDAVPVEMFRLAADKGNFDANLEAALAKLPGDLPTDLAALLRRTLAYLPADRPIAGDLRVALEHIGEAMPGVALRRWARDRDWPSAPTAAGHLDGRVITEGTLTNSDSVPLGQSIDRSSETFRIDLSERPAVPAAAPRRRWAIAGAGLGLLLIVGVGTLAWPTESKPPLQAPRPAPAALAFPPPVPRPIPSPLPVQAPVSVPAVPMPVAPAIAVPIPAIPVPIPVPVVPEPVAPVARHGVVRASPAGVTVELHAGHAVYLPGQVPVGRYELYADFGYGIANLGRYVDVVDGFETLVRCNTLRHTCDVAN